MEEKQSKQPLLYLFVALTASVCLAVSIAYLEIRRDSEVEQLRGEVAMLLQYVDVLKEKINRTETFTKKIDEMMKRFSKTNGGSGGVGGPTASGGTYDDDEEYYDEAYDYEYDELKPSNNSSREKRSVDEYGGRVHNVLHMRTHPMFQHASDSQHVMAKILITGEEQPQTDRPNHHAHRKEEEILRHHNNKHKNKNDEPEELNSCYHRPIVAHFGGDTSSITHERHYEGNHRLYHPDGVFKTWSPASWVPEMGMDAKVNIDSRGIVRIIDQPGIYYFYAQIFYADVHDSSGYRVLVNDRPVLQCTTTALSSHGSVHHIKRNSCYTGGLLKLNTGDRISLRELEGRRYTVFEHAKSFFGLFSVAKAHKS